MPIQDQTQGPPEGGSWRSQYMQNAGGQVVQPEPPPTPAQAKEQGFFRRLLHSLSLQVGGGTEAERQAQDMNILRSIPRGLAEAGNQIANTAANVASWLGEPAIRKGLREQGHSPDEIDAIVESDRQSARAFRLNSKEELDETYGERSNDPVAAFSEDFTRFTSVFILTKKLGGINSNVAAGAVTDFVATDPHDEQLAELVAQLDVPVAREIGQFLSVKETDSEMEARLKRSIEGVVVGGLVDGVFWLAKRWRALHVLRDPAASSGEKSAAQTAVEAADQKLGEIADGTHTPEGSHLVTRPNDDGTWTIRINPDSPAASSLDGLVHQTGDEAAQSLQGMSETGFAMGKPSTGVELPAGAGFPTTVEAVKAAQSKVGREEFERLVREEITARGIDPNDALAVGAATEETARRIAAEGEVARPREMTKLTDAEQAAMEPHQPPVFESRGDAELFVDVYNRAINSRLKAVAGATEEQVAQVRALARALASGDQAALDMAMDATHFNFSYTKTHPQVDALVDAVEVEFNSSFKKASKITVADETVLESVRRFWSKFSSDELPAALARMDKGTSPVLFKAAAWRAAFLDYSKQFAVMSRLLDQRPWDQTLHEEARGLLGLIHYAGESARRIQADVARAQRWPQVDLGGLLNRLRGKKEAVEAAAEAVPTDINVGAVETSPNGPKLKSKAGTKAAQGSTGAVAGNPQGELRSEADRLLADTEQRLAEMPANVRAMGLREIRDMGKLVRLSGDEPWRVFEAAQKVTIPSINPSRLNAVITVFINNLLSSVPTIAGVFTSGGGMTAFQAGAKTLAGVMRGNRALMHEGIDILYGQAKYFTENLRTMRLAWKAGHSIIRPPDALDIPSFHIRGRDVLANEGAVEAASTKALGSPEEIASAHQSMRTNAAGVITAPTRAIGAIDEFVRVSNYRASVRAQVLRDARSRGLSAAMADSEVERALKLAFDERTGAARLSRPLEYAETPTLSGPAGKKTEALLNLVHQVPALRFVMPFIRTTSNIFNFAHQVTPGLNFWNNQARRMWQLGGEERDMLIAQMGIASAMYGSAAGLYMSGSLTGGGPKNPGLRERWLASGRQPYSIKIGGKWVSYRRTEPIATILGMVADVSELVSNNPDHPEAVDAMWAFVSALTKNVSNKSYLKGMTDFAEALSGEPYKTKRWVENIGLGLVPYSQALRAFNPDPVLRETRGFIDRVRAMTPWLSETLPPKFDLWGNPVYKAPGWLNRAINPARWTDARDEQESQVDEAVASLMRNHAKMTPVLSSGIDLRDPKWKNRQGITPWERFNELLHNGFDGQMPSFEDQMREIINTPEWKAASEGTEEFPGGLRFELFAQVKGQYEQGALKRVLSEFDGMANAHFLQEARRRGSLGGRQGVQAVEEQFNQLR